MNVGRGGRLVEFVLLYCGLPLGLRFGVLPIHPFLLLWLVAGGCLVALLASPGFDRRQLWDARDLRERVPLALLPFAVAAPAIALAMIVLDPARAFRLVQERPLLWVAIMLLYPALSVYPQGIVYRAFFSHRYRPLFPTPVVRILASAVAFALAHIVFRNWIAPSLSFIGGALFAWTYETTRSSLVAGLQHAAFGCWLFTTGLGWYFYYGAVRAV